MLKFSRKNIVASCLLLLILLPTTEQIFHAWKHRNEEHCSVLNEKHFHELEHHCSFCDFNFVDSFSAPNYFSKSIATTSIIELFGIAIYHFTSSVYFKLQVRGPPSTLSI
ncbi:MAG: hypothetical protein RJA07_1938 [Bacteroidota bacterium]|jgi:hypothetical protein